MLRFGLKPLKAVEGRRLSNFFFQSPKHKAFSLLTYYNKD
jgi:hypothetical protein